MGDAKPHVLTPQEQAHYGQDRRPELYASLIVLLVLNNLFVCGRVVAHYYDRYRHETFGFNISRFLVEDCLIILSALFINIMIGNLLTATHFGLGLHYYRINHEDPEYPKNLSNAFRHVWITMVFTPSTFTWIKLTLLFFYRRIFLVNQKWLRIAWWTNIVYVVLWLIGSTGFYLFQCWPVQWYFMRYYFKYNREPPYPITGQCRATNTTNVSRPLIFGLVSDVAILLLPIFSISRLQMSLNKKIGLSGVFSIGVIACATDMARIVELMTDTDDSVDPSYGVVIFLILSVASAVAGTICACLPIIVPVAYKAYRRRIAGSKQQTSPSKVTTHPSTNNSGMRKSRGFTLLHDEASLLDPTLHGTERQVGVELGEMHPQVEGQKGGVEEPAQIWVERKVDIHYSRARATALTR